jgi:hypothetical protein
MTSCVTLGVREIDLMTASLPCSMRFANRDLALAGEQRHRAHLAQVHADGIVRLVERAGREIEIHLVSALALQLLVAIGLFRVDDLDAGASEGAEQIVQLLRRGDVGRQQLVHLVVEEVALLLADGDELSNLVVLLFNGQCRSPT